MRRQTRIGIVGCGHIAAAHLNSLRELKEKGLLGDTTVVALCDRDRWKAESFVRRGEGPAQQAGVGPEDDPMHAPPVWVSDFQDSPVPSVHSDYRELLALEDVDAILVLTSVFTHHQIGLDALRAGKHVLIEKPFAVSVKAARKLAAEGAKRGLVVGVAECVRYMPQVRISRWAFDQGYLGAPQMSVFAAGGGFWAPDKIVANTAWRHRKEMASGGVAVDWMVHTFHQLRYVFGEIAEVDAMASCVEPVRTTYDPAGRLVERVEADIDDTLSCSLRYENGAAGSVFVTWAGHGGGFALPLSFFGSKGSIKGDEIAVDGEATLGLMDFFRARADGATTERLFPRGITRFFTLEMLDFLGAIAEGRPMETSAEEGIRDLALCFASLESSLRGRRLRVRDIRSGRLSNYERSINVHHKI
jgi:1,5-anhydro-D-fructose reductase (1,5-anhydro-D-mannitol-forming)